MSEINTSDTTELLRVDFFGPYTTITPPLDGEALRGERSYSRHYSIDTKQQKGESLQQSSLSSPNVIPIEWRYLNIAHMYMSSVTGSVGVSLKKIDMPGWDAKQ